MYGRFDGEPSPEELERFFYLDDEDRKLIGKRRGEASRLGFALQLTTVRYLGTFLDDPLEVPSVVVDALAVQLTIADASCVKAYVGRANTKWEHRREICRVDGWREFASVRDELTQWIDDRAWHTGAGPKTIFEGVVRWLRQRQVLVPAVAELERLVSRVVRAAHVRLWGTLAELPTARQAGLLLDLIELPQGRRHSALELLRRGPVDRTGKALVAACHRIAQVAEIGVGDVDLGAVPQRRAVDLARRGMTSNATDLRRTRPYPKRLATLLATVVYLEAKATDDALELFDVIMTSELLARAERRSSADKLKRYPRMSKDATRLAAAVAVLLEAEEWDEGVTIAVLWDHIGNVVSKAALRASINEILPPDADPDGEWRSALMTRYPFVRKFLRLLVETIEFGATTDAQPVLDALRALPDLLGKGPTKAVPAGYLDARAVDLDVVSPGWRNLVLRRDRPAGTVERVAYVFCVLDQFHQRLRRRDIFAAASSRWADPRTQLLSGAVWQAHRESLMNSLQLPDDPGELLAECGAELDSMWRHMAARAGTGDITVDDQGRVHAAALTAIVEPASLIELRKRAQALMPRVDIGELILEVMSWHPEFTAAYTHISGGARISENLDVTLAAVLTAQALNVGWGPVVSPGVEALTRSRIGHVYQNYVRADNHAAATAALIGAQAGIGTAELWGGGLVAAVDGTRFVVPIRSVDARANPKYFGRKKGSTLLNMINDQGVGLAGMVLAGTPRDSLYAVDLMYRRDGGPRPRVFISDTGSYSDMVFGLLKLLGVAYRPELADLPDQKLWRIDPGADYGPLEQAARGRIDLAKITRHWHDIVRVPLRCTAGRSAPPMRCGCCSTAATRPSSETRWRTSDVSSKPCTYSPMSTASPTGVASNGCVTCKKNATGWANTCSTAARASCARRITPGWKTNSAHSVWSSTRSPCGTPRISMMP